MGTEAPPVRLYLVRHGRASASFAEAHDSELDEEGYRQAQAVAQELRALGPLPVVTSPLKRARATARPFETQWQVEAHVDARVAEIPAPSDNLQERAVWLHQVLQGRWSELPEFYQSWRKVLTDYLRSFSRSSIITTHFVAINVAVGAATADDRMVCFEPDYCSCTVLAVVKGTLQVVSLGRQRETLIR